MSYRTFTQKKANQPDSGEKMILFISIISNIPKRTRRSLSVFLCGDPNKGYLFRYFAMLQRDSDKELPSSPSVHPEKHCHRKKKKNHSEAHMAIGFNAWLCQIIVVHQTTRLWYMIAVWSTDTQISLSIRSTPLFTQLDRGWCKEKRVSRPGPSLCPPLQPQIVERVFIDSSGMHLTDITLKMKSTTRH